jgi:hypothetical protein
MIAKILFAFMMILITRQVSYCSLDPNYGITIKIEYNFNEYEIKPEYYNIIGNIITTNYDEESVKKNVKIMLDEYLKTPYPESTAPEAFFLLMLGSKNISPPVLLTSAIERYLTNPDQENGVRETILALPANGYSEVLPACVVEIKLGGQDVTAKFNGIIDKKWFLEELKSEINTNHPDAQAIMQESESWDKSAIITQLAAYDKDHSKVEYKVLVLMMCLI